jgi:TonB family protein
MIQWIRITLFVVCAFINKPLFGAYLPCLNKHQLMKAVSSDLEDIRKFMSEIDWSFNGAGVDESYSYFLKQIPYNRAEWISEEYGESQKFLFYHSSSRSSLVIYQANKMCFFNLVREFEQLNKGVSMVQPDMLVTTFLVSGITVEFREYKNDYSARQYSVLIYDKTAINSDFENAESGPGEENDLSKPTLNGYNDRLEEPVTFAQEMPVYPGGDNSMYSDLYKEIVYPEYEKQQQIQGTVYVSFIVEKDGSVTNVQIMREVTGGKGLNDAAIDAVNKLKRFTPGRMNGRPVRLKMNIPIKFTLKG